MSNKKRRQRGRKRSSRGLEKSDVPGYRYDPATKKYFKILEDVPGQPANSTPSDLRSKKAEEERLRRLDQAPVRKPATLLASLLGRQLGTTHEGLFCRKVFETRVMNVTTRGSTVDKLHGPEKCRFAHVSEDGSMLVRCSSSSPFDPAQLVVLFPHHKYTEEGKETLTFENNQLAGAHSTSGVTSNFEVVDFKKEPCLLYARADYDVHGALATFHRLENIRASQGVGQMRSEDNGVEIPLFKRRDCPNTEVSKIAFNEAKSRLGYATSGLFRQALYGDIGERTELTCFYRDPTSAVEDTVEDTVLALTFHETGNLAYLGTQRSGCGYFDLRTKTEGPTGSIEKKKSIHWIYRMQRSDNEIATACYDGEIKLWDLRYHKRPARTFASGKTTYFSLPCSIDRHEQLVLSSCLDGSVNGWSLQTGKKLVEILCPWKLENVKTDIPVALYADNWVGRHNAVVLAWRNELRTFELPLYP